MDLCHKGAQAFAHAGFICTKVRVYAATLVQKLGMCNPEYEFDHLQIVPDPKQREYRLLHEPKTISKVLISFYVGIRSLMAMCHV